MSDRRVLSGIAVSLFLACTAAAEMEKPSQWKSSETKDTVFAVVPKADGKTGNIVADIAGNGKVTIAGAKLGEDAQIGPYVEFDPQGKTGIQLKYEGKDDLLKGKGFTVETWVKPDKGALKSAGLLLRPGFGCISFKEDKLSIDWLNIPSQQIYAEPGTKQYNYYPTAWSMGGFKTLKVSEWNHVLVAYDENLKLLRTWINGEIDRDNELFRDGQQWLKMESGEWSLFRDMHNCKVAGFRMRVGAHHPAEPPPVRVYLNQLPWKAKMVLTADKIEPKLKLPVVIEAVLDAVPDGAFRKSLNSYDTAHLEIPMPKLAPALRTMKIRLLSAGTEVYSTTMEYNCILPAAGKGVSINPDKSFSLGGKKVFPLFMYHVQPEDMPAVKKMGFNIVSGKDFKGRWNGLPARELEDSLAYAKAAEENGLHLSFNANFKDANFEKYMGEYAKLPNIFVWYCADEPWKEFDKYRRNYNSIRGFDPNHPVITIVNNTMHMKNAAPICDIMGCDSYPIPNVSLRNVTDMTESAVKSAFGLKPVWTVLPSYETKFPTLAELRCMAALAICAGANGIGIYAWDDRIMKDGKWTGYHMAKFPDAIKTVSNVIHELKNIESVLIEPNAADAVSVDPGQPALHAALKVSGGKQYLILANDSRKEERGTITLKNGKSLVAKPLPPFGYGAEIKFASGKCELTMPAISAGVFELVE